MSDLRFNAPPIGWMNDAEMQWLHGQAQGRPRIVEIGSWRGRSTHALYTGKPRGAVLCVDTWEGVPDDPQQHRLYDHDCRIAIEAFKYHFAAQIESGTVVMVQAPSTPLPAIVLEAAPYDMVFIDGDHRYTQVAQDILIYKQLLRRRGLLAGHDYGERFPGVQQAVDELVPDVKRGPGTLWYRTIP